MEGRGRRRGAGRGRARLMLEREREACGQSERYLRMVSWMMCVRIGWRMGRVLMLLGFGVMCGGRGVAVVEVEVVMLSDVTGVIGGVCGSEGGVIGVSTSSTCWTVMMI